MRIYAYEPDGTKHLVAIECSCCDRRAKPGSEELLQDWEKSGVYYGPNDDRNLERDHCPDHKPR